MGPRNWGNSIALSGRARIPRAACSCAVTEITSWYRRRSDDRIRRPLWLAKRRAIRIGRKPCRGLKLAGYARYILIPIFVHK